MAAGFLVFVAGETLIVAGSAMDLADSARLFAAGNRMTMSSSWSAIWITSLEPEEALGPRIGEPDTGA